MENHLEGLNLEGTVIKNHRLNPYVGIEYLIMDLDNDLYSEWINSYKIPPSMITLYNWEECLHSENDNSTENNRDLVQFVRLINRCFYSLELPYNLEVKDMNDTDSKGAQ